MEVQGCRLPGFKTRQNSPNASLQLPGATQAAVILSCSSNKSLKPWQCPFMEVQGCRLPAFTTRQNSPNAYSTLCSPPRSHSGHSNFCPLPTGHSCSNLGFYGVPRRNRPRQTLCSSNKSLRPWQCPFKEVQGCRLPGFKTRQNSQTLPCSSQAPLRPRWTFPAAPTSPWGRGSVLLRRFKAAVCQASKLAKTPQTLSQGSSQAPGTQAAGVELFSFLQCFALSPRASRGNVTLCSPPRSHSGHSNFCPLPTRSLRRSQAPLRPRQILSCSSNKSLKPWQCPFMEVQGCRLPAFTTRQNSPNASLQAAADPVQLQQVPEAVAVSF